MHPVALKLAAKYLIVPAFAVTSLIIPKHYNVAHFPQGDINGYHYAAKVFDHPSPEGIQGGRVRELKITKNGKVIAEFKEGWRKFPPPEFADDFQSIAKSINDKTASEHKHSW